MRPNEILPVNAFSRLALRTALLACCALWLISVYAYYQSSAFNSNWFQTPLLWVLLLLLVPGISFSICLLLAGTRKQFRFSRYDWCVLTAALLPVCGGTLLAAWVVRGLFGMAA